MNTRTPPAKFSDEADDLRRRRVRRQAQIDPRSVVADRNGSGGSVEGFGCLDRSALPLLVVKRVTENRGKRTPGIDGKIRSTWVAKSTGAQAFRHRGYRPQPLRSIYIPESNGKKRPLGILTMRDPAIQALWKLALKSVAGTCADPNSYRFRPQRSTADAIAHCFKPLGKRGSAHWVLEGDIRGCFENISHDWLLTNVPMDKVVLRKWLSAGYVDQGALFATEAGPPQGGIISPLLVNWTLDGLEDVVHTSLASTARKRHHSRSTSYCMPMTSSSQGPRKLFYNIRFVLQLRRY